MIFSSLWCIKDRDPKQVERKVLSFQRHYSIPPRVKARFTIFSFLLSFLYSAPKAREYILIFIRRFMYIYAFCFCFLQSVPALTPLSVSPPLRASRQLPRRGSQDTTVNSGKVGGQAKKLESLPHRKVSLCLRAYLGSPMGELSQGAQAPCD